MNTNDTTSNPKPKDDSSEGTVLQAQKDLSTIRSIINTEALAQEEVKRQQHARKYVTEVVTEALNDRQQSDNSISTILVPIVEKSIEKSITQQRENFTDYVYPIVGDLVRKFATAFLRDFIEKTNELLENSLTLKSLSWRYQAWRSGVVFSRYVASQVYTYQIQQVLLIHRDTGVLLNSVSLFDDGNENSDLVSAMLTAISDFVNDSFSHNKHLNNDASSTQNDRTETYSLDEIKTDEFTLYVKRGPQALIVAAVTGNISPLAKDKLQVTLEQIHSLYLPKLKAFDGNTAIFSPTTAYLTDCLLSEEKSVPSAKKKPWLAILLFTLGLSASGYYLFVNWQTNQLVEHIYDLPTNQGIIVNRISVSGIKDVQIVVLRDPGAVSVENWLNTAEFALQKDWLSVTELPFVSLADNVIKTRISDLTSNFTTTYIQSSDADISIAYDADRNVISGDLSSVQSILFITQLNEIQGIERVAPALEVDEIADIGSTQAMREISQRALTLLSGDINQLQIDFSLASANINDTQAKRLSRVVSKFNRLRSFANDLGLHPTLLVIGASDKLGSQQVNQRLSIARAESTATALVALGLAREDIMTSGLGSIEDAPPNTNIRKAIIHVVLSNN